MSKSQIQFPFAIIFFDNDAEVAVGMNEFAETCLAKRFKVGDTVRDLERVLGLEFETIDTLARTKSALRKQVALGRDSLTSVHLIHEKINSPHYESFAVVFYE